MSLKNSAALVCYCYQIKHISCDLKNSLEIHSSLGGIKATGRCSPPAEPRSLSFPSAFHITAAQAEDRKGHPWNARWGIIQLGVPSHPKLEFTLLTHCSSVHQCWIHCFYSSDKSHFFFSTKLLLCIITSFGDWLIVFCKKQTNPKTKEKALTGYLFSSMPLWGLLWH